MLYSTYYCDWCYQQIKADMVTMSGDRHVAHIHKACADMLKVQSWQEFAALKGKLICTDCMTSLPVDEWPTCGKCIEKRQGSS